MFEVRSLQDLSRITIRHLLKKSLSGTWPLPRRSGNNRGSSRHKRRRDHRDSTSLLTNRYVFMTRLIPGPMDGNNNQSGSEDDEDDDEDEDNLENNCRAVCERIQDDEEAVAAAEVEEEEEDDEVGRREGSVLLMETQVNPLREKILSLPLPEPLKMYLLHYREK